MRGKIHNILIFLFLSPALCHATTIAFYTDGVIQEGDVYDYVSVYNNAKVDMSGGIVSEIFTAYSSSTINISGGIINILDSWDASILTLVGNPQINELGVSFSGRANIFGGTINFLKVGSSNPVNLYGGIISDYLRATSTVNIYGYGFQYDPLAGDYQGGQLTGFWLDDTPFSIDLYYNYKQGGLLIDTYSHIVLIPEPATIFLIGLGVLMQRKLKLTCRSDCGIILSQPGL
jgi:hypothetical protein